MWEQSRGGKRTKRCSTREENSWRANNFGSSPVNSTNSPPGFSIKYGQFSRLEQFAHRHRDEIKKNSQFRRHFQEMCASVGVDPLACELDPFHLYYWLAAGKGFWAEKLGVGDFYYELAVQIVEVCVFVG